jgi:hypothetical protein
MAVRSRMQVAKRHLAFVVSRTMTEPRLRVLQHDGSGPLAEFAAAAEIGTH